MVTIVFPAQNLATALLPLWQASPRCVISAVGLAAVVWGALLALCFFVWRHESRG